MDDLLSRARAYAVEMHDRHGHKRDDGGPYWQHPERVVATLAQHALPAHVLAAAWLHDVPEDCAADADECRALLRDIAERFGENVAGLVEEVTNFFPKSAKMPEKQEKLIEHAPHLSPEAKWIKLADRRDNIADMRDWNPEKQRRYAEFTLRLLEALKPWPAGSEHTVREIAAKAKPHS